MTKEYIIIAENKEDGDYLVALTGGNERTAQAMFTEAIVSGQKNVRAYEARLIGYVGTTRPLTKKEVAELSEKDKEKMRRGVWIVAKAEEVLARLRRRR
jgi:hypothetical protein